MSIAAAGQASGVAVRLDAVRQRIKDAATRAGRDGGGVTLVAVSKTFSAEQAQAAVGAGATDLGENRVQEAEQKFPDVRGNVRWHLIGPLQTNKVNKALELFDLLHGVDSLELARAIGVRAERRDKPARVLLQVNVAEKDSQHGFPETQLREQARALAAIEGLHLDGLMCIAPLSEEPEQTRPAFRDLAKLHAELADVMRDAGHPWTHLSMGMTNDYPVAIEEGATLVRVGRAIFGERGNA
ncbi:MAG TPA: YggS family pyridoxal phosphate-dependent enzyme [Chloroflexota bacterium]|nr:YggS family pyridoxal phosphate-dependent enzyme [Chloroflexota bacterium]